MALRTECLEQIFGSDKTFSSLKFSALINVSVTTYLNGQECEGKRSSKHGFHIDWGSGVDLS